MVGCVSKLFNHLEDISPNIAIQWLRESHVQKDQYHGGTFNGNNARLLLKNTDKLRSIATLDVLPLVSAFKSFDKVVSSCFGKSLHEDFSKHIDEFRNDLASLNIPITVESAYCGHPGPGATVHNNRMSTISEFKSLEARIPCNTLYYVLQYTLQTTS